MTGHNNIQIVNLLIVHPNEKKILVVKRSNSDNVFAGMYAMPGGGIDEGESVQEAAVREIKEELGVSLKTISENPIIMSPLTINDKEYIIGVYTATVNSEDFEPQDPDILSVEYVIGSVLINSLKKHQYPLQQVEILEKYFEKAGFLD